MSSLYARITKLRRRAIYRRCLAAPTRAIVLRYHSVGDPRTVADYVDPGLSLPPERFREHLRALRRNFRIVNLEEILDRLSSGAAGDPVAAVTFDDGFRDNHDIAMPILLEEGVTATFFVTSRPLEPGRWFWISELRRIVASLPPGAVEIPGLPTVRVPSPRDDRVPLRRNLTRGLSAMPEVARERAVEALVSAAGLARGAGLGGTFLTADLLRSMAAKQMIIGAHTRTHPHLDRLDPASVSEEIEAGKADLERILGVPVRHFAYPNPGGGQRVAAAVRGALESAGFHSAVTSRPGPLEFKTDPLSLARVGVYSGEQERALFEVLGS